MRNGSILIALLAAGLAAGCATGNDVVGLAGGAACIGCHGGADNATGAPPLDAHGLTSSAAVGAHTAHVDAGVACGSCHLVPATPAAPGHQSGLAEVVFPASIDPLHAARYDRASHTCTSVYCHDPGSVAPGGSLPAPTWNAPAGAIAGCGACHAAVPTTHGGIGGTPCATCHASSFEPGSSTTTLGPARGGTHADGTPDVAGHDAGWAVTNANGVTPHGLAANYQDLAAHPTGLAGCRTCHGSTLDNPMVTGIARCDGCHAGGAAWVRSCTFCHGDPARLADGFDAAGVTTRAFAPPRDAAGQAASARVGAHRVHLYGNQAPPAGSPLLTNGVACSDCHGGAGRTLPVDLAHVNGTIEVSLKAPGQIGATTGTFDAATGCAATYCHGAIARTNVRAAANAPRWTDTGTQRACGTCHMSNGVRCASGTAAGGCTTDTFSRKHDLHRCSRCHGAGLPEQSATRAGFECLACHAGYQRGLTGGYPDPARAPTMDLASHVDGAVQVRTSVSVGGTGFSWTWSPSAGTNGQCSNNTCHGVGGHKNSTATFSW